VVSRAVLAFYLDFAASTIHTSAVLTLSTLHSGDLLLDTRALAVHSASTHADPPEPIPFSLAAAPDPVLGMALTLALPRDTASFRLTFSTSPAASALQWLAPPQTAPAQPFVFSQPFVFARRERGRGRAGDGRRAQRVGKTTLIRLGRAAGGRDATG
jgi:leukotriene-A4 hydrolase